MPRRMLYDDVPRGTLPDGATDPATLDVYTVSTDIGGPVGDTWTYRADDPSSRLSVLLTFGCSVSRDAVARLAAELLDTLIAPHGALDATIVNPEGIQCPHSRRDRFMPHSPPVGPGARTSP